MYSFYKRTIKFIVLACNLIMQMKEFCPDTCIVDGKFIQHFRYITGKDRNQLRDRLNTEIPDRLQCKKSSLSSILVEFIKDACWN
jgi:hypothetical protein